MCFFEIFYESASYARVQVGVSVSRTPARWPSRALEVRWVWVWLEAQASRQRTEMQMPFESFDSDKKERAWRLDRFEKPFWVFVTAHPWIVLVLIPNLWIAGFLFSTLSNGQRQRSQRGFSLVFQVMFAHLFFHTNACFCPVSLHVRFPLYLSFFPFLPWLSTATVAVRYSGGQGAFWCLIFQDSQLGASDWIPHTLIDFLKSLSTHCICFTPALRLWSLWFRRGHSHGLLGVRGSLMSSDVSWPCVEATWICMIWIYI